MDILFIRTIYNSNSNEWDANYVLVVGAAICGSANAFAIARVQMYSPRDFDRGASAVRPICVHLHRYTMPVSGADPSTS